MIIHSAQSPNLKNGMSSLDDKQANDKLNDEKKDAVSENKNKDDHVLSVDKETAFFLASGGRSEHMLVNTGDKTIAVKIRCSNNKLYRVTPVHMIVDVGQCQNLVITKLAGPQRSDKLIIQFMTCKPEDTDAKELFSKLPTDFKPDCIRINLKVVPPEELVAIGCSDTSGTSQDVKPPKSNGTKEMC